MKIYNENCISGSKKHLKDNSIDLIICDPPFGIEETKFDKHYKRESNNVLAGYEEAPKDYYTFSKEWIQEACRALKNDGSMYIISGWTNLGNIINVIKEFNLYIENHIIWKYNFGVNTTKKFVSSHYHILYIKKQKNSKVIFNRNCRFGDDEKDGSNKSLLYQDLQDVWVINKEYCPGKIKNQNKLPEELIKKIILYSSNEKDIVCDFFLGNFTTAIVSKKLNRVPAGFEINNNSFDYFFNVLQSIKRGCDLKDLRKVPKNKSVNRGKSITKQDIDMICKEYKFIRKNDKKITKKNAILKVGEKFKRGYFSILNILNNKKIK